MPTWKYPKADPAFDEPGMYRAWISNSADRNCSVAAWRVESSDPTEAAIVIVKISKGESTAPRAGLAACAGTVESLPPYSSVVLCSNNEYVINALNEDIQKWSAAGWRNEKGPLKNVDILQRIQEVIASRHLVVTAKYCGDDNSEDAKVLADLRAMASLARKQKAA